MAWDTEWLWILPPDATTEEVDRVLAELTAQYRRARWKDRFRRLVR